MSNIITVSRMFHNPAAVNSSFSTIQMKSSGADDEETATVFCRKVVLNQETESVEKMKKKKRRYRFVPKFGFTKLDDVSTAERPLVSGTSNAKTEGDGMDQDHQPTHLIVVVNGVFGRARHWRFTIKQFMKAYPHDVMIYCTKSNCSKSTFDGVDVIGKRLADEVIYVVNHHPNLQNISFVGHSLGGLVARYAAACLYRQDYMRNADTSNGDCRLDEPVGKIAELKPVNFITLATPHLGSRGRKQVPILCGFHAAEKVALRSSGLLGRTGVQLFLKDCEGVPLLLRMSEDSDNLKFISALQSFKRRVVYANTCFDHLVAWGSSSLRLRNELPELRNLVKNTKYPHIVNEDASENPTPKVVSSYAAKSKSSDMEEIMIGGLTQLNWERVDVNFSGSIQRFLAHGSIQVKYYCVHSAGADIIQHMVDSFQL